MRHNYVNDIGDYAKYALLRALCLNAAERVQLGVIWYLTDHEVQNGDGRKRAHLYQDGWDGLDPDLLREMREIENKLGSQDELSIGLIETSRILPAGTAYFSEAVPSASGPREQREAERAAWFGRAQKAMTDSNLVFLDPDNGLEVRSAPLTSPRASRYATVREISALLEGDTAVILYQHGSRTPWGAQREDICQRIVQGTGRPTTIRSLRFGAYGLRAFFCITACPHMTEVIDNGLDRLRRNSQDWDKAHYLIFE